VKKIIGIILIAVAAALGVYFMYLMAAPVAQGFLGCLKTLGV
jgi:hypothetical protein